ncbi:hypothetical protein [Glutamicibacter arilaitensis]|uniref:hypothetical protein n=1 Tax=Glutamicibacter arilaitensis TaxID=256701 RepID=UPI00384EABFA
MSSEVYVFQDVARREEVSLWFEDERIAIDMNPICTPHEAARSLNRGYEVIMPVDEVENLITNLQTMVAKIRENFPDAA